MKPVLCFIYADGCPACEMAKPELIKFRNANPHILVRYYDITKPPNAGGWPDGGWNPNATPTYLATFANRQPVGYVGWMKKEEIVTFLRIACGKLGLEPAV